VIKIYLSCLTCDQRHMILAQSWAEAMAEAKAWRIQHNGHQISEVGGVVNDDCKRSS